MSFICGRRVSVTANFEKGGVFLILSKDKKDEIEEDKEGGGKEEKLRTQSPCWRTAAIKEKKETRALNHGGKAREKEGEVGLRIYDSGGEKERANPLL